MVPLISEQATSGTVNGLLDEDGAIAVWWGTWAECAVAISRLRREEVLNYDDGLMSRIVPGLIAGAWTEVGPTDDVRLTAAILSQDHPLKTADALQLAAALRWCEGDTGSAGFVCLDDRLRRAARGEGFDVLPVLPENR